VLLEQGAVEARLQQVIKGSVRAVQEKMAACRRLESPCSISKLSHFPHQCVYHSPTEKNAREIYHLISLPEKNLILCTFVT
jgi:hypothetical protein